MSQGRVPLSQTESAKDSGHYPVIPMDLSDPAKHLFVAAKVRECTRPCSATGHEH